MESDSHALKTCLFLLVGGALFALTFVVFGDRSPPSEPYVVLTTETVAGLSVDSRVYYKGVQVGRVREIGFSEDDFNEVRVLIEVDESIPLGQNTYAQLELRGITGEYDLTLDNDGPLGPPLEPPASGKPPVIPMRTQYIVRIGESVEQALAQIEGLASDLRILTGEENREKIATILDGAADAFERLGALESKVAEALDGVPDTLDDIGPAVERFGAAMEEIRATAQSLTTRTRGIDPLIETAQRATASLDRLLQSMQGETLMDVDETLEALRQALRQLADLAESLRQDPQRILLGPPPQRLGPGEGRREP